MSLAGNGLRVTLLLAVLTGLATAAGAALGAEEEPNQPTISVGDRRAGEELYQRDCAVCHGPRGVGTTNGPALDEEGTASIDFVLRTGRMPIPHPDAEIGRDVARRINGVPVEYGEQEISDIVAYASEWTTGPEVPPVGVVERGQEALSHGGELWRRNCAACHQLAGQGGVLLQDVEIPSVASSSPQVIADAIRAGPRSMPAFDEGTVSEQDVAEMTLFITRELQQPTDPGGWAAGHLGPFAEGAVVWIVGIPGVLLAAAWIGRRT